MLFNKKWIYVLKRISNGAHKIIFMFFFLHAHRCCCCFLSFRDLWFCVHIVYRISTQLIEQQQENTFMRRTLCNIKLAYKLQCSDSWQVIYVSESKNGNFKYFIASEFDEILKNFSFSMCMQKKSQFRLKAMCWQLCQSIKEPHRTKWLHFYKIADNAFPWMCFSQPCFMFSVYTKCK